LLFPEYQPDYEISEVRSDTPDERAETTRQLMRVTGSPMTSRVSRMFYPWWPSPHDDGQTATVWHARTALADDREGLLVDVGAHDNLMSDGWLQRVRALRAKSGLPDATLSSMDRPLGVEGVGQGAQRCTQSATVPLSLLDGSGATFTAV
jgi:hypothetical protein